MEEKIMTPEEFAEYMQHLQDLESGYGHGYDTELIHRRMDTLMCELLCDLGYEDGVKIFESTSKWYA